MHDKKFYFIILFFLSNFLLNYIGLPLDICYGTNAVEFLPHPESCINYILCVLETPTVLDCEPNQIYNQANSRCEPGNPETCELYADTTSTTTIVTQTEPESTTSHFTEDTTILVDSTTDQIPTTSTTEQLSTTIEETTTTSHTDSTIMPESTSESSSTSKITTTSMRSTTTTTSPPIHRCPPSGNGYIPHYTNCTRYFECINGIRFLRFCPDELLFDSVTLQCTTPDLAVCAGT